MFNLYNYIIYIQNWWNKLKYYFNYILNLSFFKCCITHLLSLLQVVKRNKSKLKVLKLVIFISINMLLMFFFFDIIKNNNCLINNNEILTNVQLLIQPVLLKLNIVVNVNIQKLIIITIIIIIINLISWYLNRMLTFLLLSFITKYSYNSYIKYLNQEGLNQEGLYKGGLNYYGFKFQNITDVEKEQIFQEYLKNKSIKDSSTIEYLKNKMTTIQSTDKKDFILNMDINLLEYKQRILAHLIIKQEQKLTKMQNKNTSFWEHLDSDTMLKIGGIVIIVGLIALGGYYYYYYNNSSSNNSSSNNSSSNNNNNNNSSNDSNNNIEIVESQSILDEVKKESKNAEIILKESKNAEMILEELKSEAKFSEYILNELKETQAKAVLKQVAPSPGKILDNINDASDTASTVSLILKYLVDTDGVVGISRISRSSINDWLNLKMGDVTIEVRDKVTGETLESTKLAEAKVEVTENDFPTCNKDYKFPPEYPGFTKKD